MNGEHVRVIVLFDVNRQGIDLFHCDNLVWR
jgi:hypothetical protein